MGSRRLERQAIVLLAIVAMALSACATPEDQAAGDNGAVKVDLARVVAAGSVRPVDGITSSGQPDAAALEVFRDSGYTAVIDLRGEGEDRGFDEKATVEALGMNYAALPIASAGDIDFDTAKRLDALIREQQGPVLLHCGSGNRVGAMLALIESLEGADTEAAIARGKQAGLTGLEDVVRERLAEGPGEE